MPEQTYEELLREATLKTGSKLKYHTNRKAAGACPVCGGTDRFIVWLYEKSGWCSHCQHRVYWGDGQQTDSKRNRQEENKGLLEKMKTVTLWKTYHDQLTEESRKIWYAEGMTDEEIDKYGLGWCKSTPLAKDFESLTIPVWGRFGLVDIRYRLIGGEQGNKYRSHLAGLIPSVYNSQDLAAPVVVVVEGEKKAILLKRVFPAVVGLAGVQLLEQIVDELREIKNYPTLILALDPFLEGNIEGRAKALLEKHGHTVLTASFFMKPDDMLLKYGTDLVEQIVSMAI